MKIHVKFKICSRLQKLENALVIGYEIKNSVKELKLKASIKIMNKKFRKPKKLYTSDTNIKELLANLHKSKKYHNQI